MELARLRNRWSFLSALVVLFIALAAIIGSTPARNETPYALDGTGKDGLRAWVVLLESFGANVENNAKPLRGELDVVVDFGGDYNEQQSDEIEEWVRAGGHLVVFGTSSAFSPPGAEGFGGGNLERGCKYSELSGVSTIDPGGVQLINAEDSDVACFREGDGAFLTVNKLGRGEVIQLASRDVFTNQRVDKHDNALLAVRLFSGDPTTVRILEARGTQTAFSLIGDNVWFFLVQAFLALALWVLWKARRLGTPVNERLPVVVPGSELVVAMGDLFQQGRHRQHVANQLANGLARDLRKVLGTSERDIKQLAERSSARFDVDPIVVKQLLQPFISQDGQLLAYGRAVANFRSEVLDVKRRANVF